MSAMSREVSRIGNDRLRLEDGKPDDQITDALLRIFQHITSMHIRLYYCVLVQRAHLV